MPRAPVNNLLSSLAFGLIILIVAAGPGGAETRTADPAAAGNPAPTMPAGSFDYETDPPRGAISCGKRVTVRASKYCGGKPAAIVGGCNQSSKPGGQSRRVTCQ